MRNLRFYRLFILENKLFCIAFVIIGILNNITNLLIPISVGRFYELMFHGQSNKGFILDALQLNFGKSFDSFIFCFLLMIILKAIFEFTHKLLKDRIEEKFISNIRSFTFKQQIDAQYILHQKKATAKYLSRFSSDFGSMKKGLSVGILIFFADVVFSIFAIIFLININSTLTLISVLGLVVHIISLSSLESKRKALLLERQDSKAAYLNFVSERFHSFSTIKIFERSRIETKRFEKKADIMSASFLNYSFIRSLENALIPTGIYLIICILLFSIFKLSDTSDSIFDGTSSIAFILLIFSIRPILKRFLKVRVHWKNAELSIQKSLSLETSRMEVPKLNFCDGTITFTSVCFGYDSSKRVLNNLSFEARKNQITRICGSSCTGKTTVYRLITKLFSPQHGKICIDGQDIQCVSGVRKHIGVVSEEFPFVGRDIFEAITESKSEDSRQKASAILKNLCQTFQLKQPLLLHQLLINGGSNLSQTEKKVLIFARAILSEKPILLFDEPFAGMSDHTTHFLGLYINELKRNRTILVISSRNCHTIEYDKIVDLDRLLPQFDVSIFENRFNFQ